MAAKKIKPEPVPTNIVCSVCGEPWDHHIPDAKGEVSMLECVRILKHKPCHHWSWTVPHTISGVAIGGNTTGGYNTINAIEAASAVN